MTTKSDDSLVLEGSSLQGRIDAEKMKKLFQTLGEGELAELIEKNPRAAAGWIKSKEREGEERNLKQDKKIEALKVRMNDGKIEREKLSEAIAQLNKERTYIKGGIAVICALWALLTFAAPYVIPAGIKAGEAKWKEKVCAQVVECRKGKGEKGKAGK